MRLVNKQVLQDFKAAHLDATTQINAWVAEVEKAQWDGPHRLKERYPKASVIGNQNVVFDIRGGRYRLWVKVDYKNSIVLVKKAGTHQEYDKWKIT